MNLPILKKCAFCELDNALPELDFCSVECARWFKLCERIKKIENLLVEIKYEIRNYR
jgi:hypothetical protein